MMFKTKSKTVYKKYRLNQEQTTTQILEQNSSKRNGLHISLNEQLNIIDSIYLLVRFSRE